MTTDNRLVAALALLAAVVLLYEGRSVLIPIVLSVLVSYALDPVAPGWSASRCLVWPEPPAAASLVPGGNFLAQSG
ncbi:MAG TPA: hypothetical protein VES67_06355 [Vicinamibacterales bacterium]|nr:hypothetical protein [Vicinamibacterales bacterium]